jgi:hypothetical protein
VLGQLIAAPVAQKWDGTMIYDVTDTGRQFGYGVRGSWTNVELSFHTDNAFGVAPPDYVGLLCLMPAREGGISRFCSLYTVHNEMLRRHPVSSRASTGRSTTIARPSTPPATRRSRGCPASTMKPAVSERASHQASCARAMR